MSGGVAAVVVAAGRGTRAGAGGPKQYRLVRGAPVITCRDLRKSYGTVTAVRGVSFSVHAGEIVCLVGDNGAGKSTLVRSLSGVEARDEGDVIFDGELRNCGHKFSAPLASIGELMYDFRF